MTEPTGDQPLRAALVKYLGDKLTRLALLALGVLKRKAHNHSHLQNIPITTLAVAQKDYDKCLQ